MKKASFKTLVIAFVLTLGLASMQSCKKDTAVTECFPDEMSATFVGSGSIEGTPYTGSFKITKKSCTEATLEAEAVGYSADVEDLKASASGLFAGKTTDGKDVSISLSGVNVTIQVEGEVDFRGTKQ